jgi:hypothetical protein
VRNSKEKVAQEISHPSRDNTVPKYSDVSRPRSPSLIVSRNEVACLCKNCTGRSKRVYDPYNDDYINE